MKLSEAQVLVTGGGRGIGRHLVGRLIGAAAKIVVFERDEELCRKLLEVFPKQVEVWPCDVTRPAEIEGALESVFSAGYEINVLINNAGLIHSAPLVNILAKEERVHSLAKWHEVMDANLHSVFYMTGQMVNHLLAKRRKGVVISMSSISANGNPGQSAYAAAKAGVNALTQTWAKELGPMGLRFVAIAPGFLDTPSTRAAVSEANLARLQGEIPLRQLGIPEHVFQAVQFCIENDYLTGTVLEIDGGLVI